MFKLLSKEKLGDAVVKIEIDAPQVSAKIGPGQFVIIRSHEYGERIPLTVADFDREKGPKTNKYMEFSSEVPECFTNILNKFKEELWILQFQANMKK